MRRREFMTLLGGAAATWPLAARAQVLDKVPIPDGKMTTRKSLVVESGKSAVVEA